MPKPTQPPAPRTTSIIRDCRKSNMDYKLPAARAHELYSQGRLQFDATNGQYCTPTQAKVL